MTGAWLSLWAAPAAVGFALFFNVRRRTLVPIALLAMAAHLVRSGLEAAGAHLVGASLVAAFTVGAAAYLLGPATGEASPVYAFAPVIPLIPGTLLFDGFEAVGELVSVTGSGEASTALLVRALDDLLTAAAVVLALALGTTAPGLLRPRARQRN
jgi:uncharacterized membrane protein YjjB (DUF3815 family)